MRTLYRAEGLPTFQNVVFPTRTDAVTCPRGEVRLIQDERTGLIYNDAFRPEDAIYGTNYQNEQANSPLFRAHLNDIAGIIEADLGRHDLVEIGCGKGYFLEMLQKRGATIRGCDPTYEGANPSIIREYFGPELGMKPGSGLILRHVLEHIQNPVSFLREMRSANGGAGLVYIEVPDFDWILDHRAWFDVFYEHVNYFRLDDFMRMFGTVVRAERTFGGQYLSIVADLATLRVPEKGDEVTMPDVFAPNPLAFPAGAVIWGAASKGVIFSLMMDMAGRPVSTVVDINPSKQGRYLPVTGLKVTPPSEALASLPSGGTILVMNGNYLDEVRAMAGDAFNCVAVDTIGGLL